MRLLAIVVVLFLVSAQEVVGDSHCQCSCVGPTLMGGTGYDFGEIPLASCAQCTAEECRKSFPCTEDISHLQEHECVDTTVDWNGEFTVEHDLTGAPPAHCDQDQCCCPSGKFTLSNFDAKAKTVNIATEWVGKRCNSALVLHKLTFQKLFDTSGETTVIANAGDGSGAAFYVRKTDKSIVFSAREINLSLGSCGFTLTAAGGLGGGLVFLIVLLVIFILSGLTFLAYRYKKVGKFTPV